MADEAGIRRVAMLGNHLPRQCGIATFTTHLSEAIASVAPDVDCFVLAMNDGLHKHAYPARVRFELSDSDTGAYTRAADFLNVNAVDVLSVQHEYGIFGGKAGGHVLSLLRELRMPIVTTLHTILTAPNPHQRRVMDELTAISDRLVVMTNGSADILREVHGVAAQKIDMIPHGIPSVPFSGSKDRLGVEGRPLILTFGLLGPDKGIEHVIDALPTILSHYPDAVYIVLGATHPHIVERHGETYRLMLEERAKQLGVDGNVIFHNRFVSQAELCEFLAAADIYITPYLNPEQITSGTLAYALGAGKAVISTPYAYAKELLADGRGILVPWRDSSAIAAEIVGLLDDPEKRLDLRLRAAEHGRAMLWPAVAQSYLRSFEQARVEHTQRLRAAFRARTLATRPAELPHVNLEHVAVMTDDTGMLQHATFNVPRYDEGYCVDDNARALMLMTLLEDAGSEDPKLVRSLASRYLAFVSHAFNRQLGRFRNFMSHSRVWREEQGSEDSHGRALWALGTVVGCSDDPGRHGLAGALFHAGLPAVSTFSSPRAWAFALLGIEQYLRAFEGDRNVQAAGRTIAGRLLGLFKRTDHPEWPWFENSVTYCNARLPQALIATASWTGDAEMAATGLRSLEWLTTIQRTPEGYFAPVGTNGFFERGSTAAVFDQQPVDACATVSACMHAFRTTGDQRWADQARRAFTWFLGQNQLHLPLYDPLSGGCRDALHVDRLNENQGAESTLSFLLALMDMRAFETQRAAVASNVLVAVSA
ncbi:MAG TPA: glycosyltransferase family 4 protein [Thermoanaerobaculia bacterium]|jgi:glycosyltransferase involved in cell wall biosynthesis|nr:glycosyltransferase family 4 protein [Thermoanaerobaculia bacterium]